MNTRNTLAALALAIFVSAFAGVPAGGQTAAAAPNIWQSILNLLAPKKEARKPAVRSAAPAKSSTSSISSISSVRRHRAAPEITEPRMTDLPIQNVFLRMHTSGSEPPPFDLRRPPPGGSEREAAPVIGPLWPTGTYQGDEAANTSADGDEGDADGQDDDGNVAGGTVRGGGGNSRSAGGSSRGGGGSRSSLGGSSSSRSGPGSSSVSSSKGIPEDQLCILDPDAADPRARAAIRNGAVQKQRYPVTYAGKKPEDILELPEKFYERYDRGLYTVYYDEFGFIRALEIRDPAIVLDGGKDVTWEEQQAVQQLIIDNAEAFGIQDPGSFSLEQCFLSVSGLSIVPAEPALMSFQMFSPDGLRRHIQPMAVMKYPADAPTILVSGHLWPRAYLPNNPSILRSHMRKSIEGTEVRYTGRAPLPCSEDRTQNGSMPCDIADPAYHVEIDISRQVESGGISLSSESEALFGSWFWLVPQKNGRSEQGQTCPRRNAEIRYVWSAGMQVPVGDGIGPLFVYYPRDGVTGAELRPIQGSIGGLPVECNRECEDDEDGSTCVIQCRGPQCGDGKLDLGWEICDDGNNDDGDQCPANCRPPSTCGNNWCDRDWGETAENCPSDCSDLVCQCEVLPKVDTNGYAWGMDALSPEDAETRTRDFMERNDGTPVTAKLDQWGFISTMVLRNSQFGSGPFTRWQVEEILDIFHRNADFFGIDNVDALQWTFTNYASGVIGRNLDDIDRGSYFTMYTSDPLAPIMVQKSDASVVITGHAWPGMFLPGGHTVKRCDILKKIIGKEVHVTGRLRRVDENRYPIPESEEDVDIHYTIQGEDVTLSSPRPPGLWFTEENGRARVEARYVYRPQIRLRLSRELEEVRITPALDAITGEQLNPLPRELHVPEDMERYSGRMGSMESLSKTQSSSSAPSQTAEEEPSASEEFFELLFPDDQ